MPYSNNDFFASRVTHFLNDRVLGNSETQLPSLTISRDLGTGFDRIKRDLIEYLDEVDDHDGETWALFDQSLLSYAIERNTLDSAVDKFDLENARYQNMEKLQKHLDIQRSDWSMFNHTSNTIRTLCRKGHAIIVGRIGNLITSDISNTFHVRLVAPMEERIAELQRRRNITSDHAEDILQKSDKTRKEYIKKYSGADYTDPTLYNLTINTEQVTDEVLVKIIGDSMMDWAWGKTGQPIAIFC